MTKLAQKYGLEYRTDEYLKEEGIYNQMKAKCRKDKEYLSVVMQKLQEFRPGASSGNAALLRQYNEDVRLMRTNEEMLKKYEYLLKKAEVNDYGAL